MDMPRQSDLACVNSAQPPRPLFHHINNAEDSQLGSSFIYRFPVGVVLVPDISFPFSRGTTYVCLSLCISVARPFLCLHVGIESSLYSSVERINEIPAPTDPVARQ